MSRRVAIFDLDGVLVDSARLHFIAWKRIAEELGIAFSEHDNEALKGVDRMQSLALILKKGDLTLERAEQERIAARKNSHYLDLVAGLRPDDLLPGARELVLAARAAGMGCALASASRNAPLLLHKVGLDGAFDFIADPGQYRPKPAPDLFLAGANALGAVPQACIGFEDSVAGIAAILAAGMLAVGIGAAQTLGAAHIVYDSTAAIDLGALLARQV